MKAQAALEFLVTHAWIIIAVLAVAFVLAYLGYLNPNQFIPEDCKFSEQIICEEIQLTDSLLKVRLQNSFIVSVNISNVENSDTGINCPLLTIPPGRTEELECTGSFSQYDQNPLRLNVTFIRTDGTAEHNFETYIATRIT